MRPESKEEADIRLVAGYGTVIFVIIFFALQASDQSTGFKYMLTAVVKSVPAQFLAWTVSRN